MFYPTSLVNISDTLSLKIPIPELIRPVYENLLAKNALTPFPFWAQIWPSAKVMTAFLQEQPEWIQNKRVLELGAGIGLPSFSIADQVAELLITDHDKDAVSLIEENILYVGLKNAKAKCINWNDFPYDLNAEVLLLSDINYAPDQFKPLLNLIHSCLIRHTIIILTTPQRITITPFAEALQPFITKSVVKSIEHSGQLVEIRLLLLSK